MLGLPKNKYDLEERPQKFGEIMIELCTRLLVTSVTRRIIIQLVGCRVSLSNNDLEAISACSRPDLRNKFQTDLKEGNESQCWLKMATKAGPNHAAKAQQLWHKAYEITLILRSIGLRVKNVMRAAINETCEYCFLKIINFRSQLYGFFDMIAMSNISST